MAAGVASSCTQTDLARTDVLDGEGLVEVGAQYRAHPSLGLVATTTVTNETIAPLKTLLQQVLHTGPRRANGVIELEAGADPGQLLPMGCVAGGACLRFGRETGQPERDVLLFDFDGPLAPPFLDATRVLPNALNDANANGTSLDEALQRFGIPFGGSQLQRLNALVPPGAGRELFITVRADEAEIAYRGHEHGLWIPIDVRVGAPGEVRVTCDTSAPGGAISPSALRSSRR